MILVLWVVVAAVVSIAAGITVYMFASWLQSPKPWSERPEPETTLCRCETCETDFDVFRVTTTMEETTGVQWCPFCGAEL